MEFKVYTEQHEAPHGLRFFPVITAALDAGYELVLSDVDNFARLALRGDIATQRRLMQAERDAEHLVDEKARAYGGTLRTRIHPRQIGPRGSFRRARKVTPKELSRAFGVTLMTLYSWRKLPDPLPATKLDGWHISFETHEVLEWTRRCRPHLEEQALRLVNKD